jgi:hypothetical protein
VLNYPTHFRVDWEKSNATSLTVRWSPSDPCPGQLVTHTLRVIRMADTLSGVEKDRDILFQGKTKNEKWSSFDLTWSPIMGRRDT